MKILVVDDDHEMRQLILATLKGAGYQDFEEASDGVSGLRALEGVDLVLADLHMPGMSGGSLIREIRSNQRTSHLPVIAITSDSEETTVSRIVREGVEAYLIKPFDTKMLVEKVNNVRNKLIAQGRLPG